MHKAGAQGVPTPGAVACFHGDQPSGPQAVERSDSFGAEGEAQPTRLCEPTSHPQGDGSRGGAEANDRFVP